MERWNDALCRLRNGSLHLANRSRTLVKVKRGIKFRPEELFLRLQDVGFPLAYADGLEVIRFTTLTGSNRGWYLDGEATIDVSRGGASCVLETFVHEVGHHVDEEEGASQGLDEERRKGARFLRSLGASDNARESEEEYLAAGFELFYSEDPKKRARLRARNPKLYRTIGRLDRQFRAR